MQFWLAFEFLRALLGRHWEAVGGATRAFWGCFHENVEGFAAGAGPAEGGGGKPPGFLNFLNGFYFFV